GGPEVKLQKDGSANPTFTAPDLREGAVLTFVAGVSDGENSAFDTVRIVVAPNLGPEVSIQGGTEVAAGNMHIVGAAAVDPDGDDLQYRWTQIGGPNVNIQQDDKPLLRFQAPDVAKDTALMFQVEVSDGDRVTTQVVTVNVQAPEEAVSSKGMAASSTTSAATPATTTSSATTTAADAGSLAQPTTTSTGTNVTPAVTAADLTSGAAAATADSATVLAGSTDDASPGLLAAVVLDESSSVLADSDADADVGGSTLASTLTDSTLGSALGSNLLEEPAVAATAGATRIELPDLVLVEAGEALELAPRAAVEVSEAELAEAQWTQISGTPVELEGASDDGMLRIRTPEVFVEEELIFEVEVFRGGERVVQEVTVQVQPVGMSSRSLSIDQHLEQRDGAGEADEEQGARGVGRIWGALLAFFGAQSGRKKRDS
ncbi:MAG: hypothetical protein KAI24_09950, partial [Planctomycetes bacterium]|nr:hypothetical protein [Planctomycetota bacterium]